MYVTYYSDSSIFQTISWEVTGNTFHLLEYRTLCKSQTGQKNNIKYRNLVRLKPSIKPKPDTKRQGMRLSVCLI
jgi:hypothetical protein